MQQKRNRERGLMAPLIICSVLLTLSVLAVWTGMYQYQAVEAVEADVTSLATTDNNHFLVVLLWFVPVSVAVLTTVWVRRSRNNADDEAR
jgi:heme/copper-type cytochrome/quinol oxidase subunit 2